MEGKANFCRCWNWIIKDFYSQTNASGTNIRDLLEEENPYQLGFFDGLEVDLEHVNFGIMFILTRPIKVDSFFVLEIGLFGIQESQTVATSPSPKALSTALHVKLSPSSSKTSSHFIFLYLLSALQFFILKCSVFCVMHEQKKY